MNNNLLTELDPLTELIYVLISKGVPVIVNGKEYNNSAKKENKEDLESISQIDIIDYETV